MDEYISRGVLLAEIAADHGNWIAYNDTDESYRQGVKDNYSDTIRLINDIPAADVQPVKYGEWEYEDIIGGMKDYHCTNCKCVADENQILWWKFCPNCGSKNRMDGDCE